MRQWVPKQTRIYVDHLEADLSDYASGIVGVVRLRANTSAVTQFLPVGIAGFVTANPGIRIDFVDAADFEIVSLAGSTSLAQRLRLEAEALGKRLKLRIQVRCFDAMCQMVAAGLGAAGAVVDGAFARRIPP